MTFLDASYVKPASNSRYYKFQTGENKFRILSSAITGWVDWKEEADGSRKPVRTKEKPAQFFDPKKPAKHFWSFVIYDLKEKNIKIMEITQATIQDAIYNLHNSEDWGSPLNYNLTISRTGEKMETKYNVLPSPKTELTEEIKEAYKAETINLDALYTNDDPFAVKGTLEDANRMVEEEKKNEIPVEDLPF